MQKKILAACCAAIATGILSGHASALELEPNGRLHWDYASHEEDVRTLEDDDFVRRARLGLEGSLNEHWAFEVAYEFTNDGEFEEGEFKDAYIEYSGWDLGTITAGQFKVPFGFERQLSSNSHPFIERALPSDVFSQSRRVGLGFGTGSKYYTFALMGYGASIDGDEGDGVAARYTYAPINDGDDLLHLGVAVASDKLDERPNFRAYPESRPTDHRFVRTGRLDDVERVNQLGLEFAWQKGPFSTQAEWMRADVQRENGASDAELDGWYASASWILTGEARGYKNGRFRDIDPSRRSGAWELNARYSEVNLDDQDMEGGRQNNTTIGINWYAQKYARVMLNYIMVDSERRGESDDPRILLLRAQLSF